MRAFLLALQPYICCRQKPASQGNCPRQPGNCVSHLAARAFDVDGGRMKITRSSKSSLKYCTAAKRAALYEFMDEYSRVVNLFIDRFWENTPILAELKKDIIGIADSWLSFRARQCAAREAVGMIVGQRRAAKSTGRPLVKPVHYGKTIALSANCARIEQGHNTFDLWVTLYSLGNKKKILLPVKAHRQINKFADWEMASSVVIGRDYVQFSFEKETGPKRTNGENLGVDVGINVLLATSAGEFVGTDVKRLIGNIKRKQSGSRKQKAAISTLSYYLHKQVKELFALHPDLRLVVVEKLQGLKQGKQPNRGKGFRKTLSSWRYRQLLDIIQLRTEENRVSFRSVSPYHTSQACPICSHTERGNRSGEKFHCLKCGYSEHADVVGAMNILGRFTSGQYGAAFQAGVA